MMPGRGRTSVRPTFCEMFHQSEWCSASRPVSAALMPKQSARSSSRCESTERYSGHLVRVRVRVRVWVWVRVRARVRVRVRVTE